MIKANSNNSHATKASQKFFNHKSAPFASRSSLSQNPIAEREDEGDDVSEESGETENLNGDQEADTKEQEPPRRRLIIVVYELPITCTRDTNGKWSVKMDDSSNFYANFRLLQQQMDVMWVGYPRVEVPKNEQEAVKEPLLASRGLDDGSGLGDATLVA